MILIALLIPICSSDRSLRQARTHEPFSRPRPADGAQRRRDGARCPWRTQELQERHFSDGMALRRADARLDNHFESAHITRMKFMFASVWQLAALLLLGLTGCRSSPSGAPDDGRVAGGVYSNSF